MMGGSESGSGEKDGIHSMKIHVPIGWQRRVDDGLVVYVSPSGTALSSLDEVRTYLLTDGTCKCGLECPLVMHKVFNFSRGVKVQHQSQPLGRTEQDMTKLCNHRRKVVAMAALCRSMQASQLPYIPNQPEVSSVVMENRGPKRIQVEQGEDYRGTYQPKHQLVSVRPNHNLNPASSGSPKCSPQLIYPYNGFSPFTHSSTNSNNSLEALRRLQNPPLPLSATSSGSTTSPFSSYNASQRSPRTPVPHNLSQGQRVTPQTPEIPGSPRLRPLSPSSPVVLTGGGRKGAHASHHPHGVIVSSPLSPSFSPSCSPSPSVNSINCPSPLQRSRHPSASSLLSEHGVGSGGAGGGGMVIGGGGGCGYPRRRKSSSSPQSPNPAGSPNSPLNCPKYKLEEILEQFKSSGNASTNNHQHLLPPSSSSSSLLTNQSNPHNQLSVAHERDGKPLLKALDPVSSGPAGFGPSSAGVGPFSNHSHSHPARQLHPVSFPASSLLSAAAKAQVAQMTQNSSLNSGCLTLNMTSPLELSKEIQQQQSSKVTNSTLHYSHPSTPIPTSRPHPPLAATSTFLFPPSHLLAQSMASSSTPFLPPVMERNASHRKRQRRSPTVLSMLKDAHMPNGPRKTLGDSSVINLSSTSSYSTSAAQSDHIPNTVLGNHHHLLQAQTRLASHQTGHQKQTEALDFTTALAVAGFPLNLDPPTQPLSALLHLLSVQNAQASVSAQHGSGPSFAVVGGGGSNRNSPRQSSCSPQPHFNTRPLQTQSPLPSNTNNTLASTAHPLSPSQSRCRQSPSLLGGAESPVQGLSPASPLSNPHPAHLHSSMSRGSSFSPPRLNHVPDMDSVSQLPLRLASPEVTTTTELDRCIISTEDQGHTQSGGSPVTPVASSTSPKPLDLSNHVLALLTATSTLPQGEGSTDSTTTLGQKTTGTQHHQVSVGKKAPGVKSPATSPQNLSPSGGQSSPNTPSNLGENGSTPLPLAEAFPFMNQEQLLQLLSTTGGLPSLLDPTILASFPLGGLWLQHAQLPGATAPQPPQHLSDQQQQLLIEHEEALQQSQEQQQQQHKQQSNNHIHHNPLFPLLPFLMGPQGELPLNLLGLMNPLPTPTVPAHSPGQENDLGLAEKPGLQALLMASLLLGQQQAAMLPLSGLGHLSQLNLELPLNQQHQLPATLEGLSLDKTSGLDLSALPGPGLLEVLQGLLPPLPPAEGPLQALHALLFPGPLPQAPAAFLPLSPALLSAALGSSELQSPHTQQPPTQHTQQPNCQVTSSVTAESGVETLIPLSSLQAKDNHILQQLLLNPTILGDLSTLTSLHSMLGLGAGPLLMPPEQASALGMPLLQGPDGAINLLNNIQLNITNQSEGDKPIVLQETDNPSQQEEIPSSRLSIEAVPSPSSARAQTPIAQCVGDGSVCSGGVLNPYASFMETIYTSFLQVSAKEEQEAQEAQSGSDDTTALCALPPSYPGEHPQASAPVSLSPRRACSIRNSDLSRLNMEAAAHSPAQGTPKLSEDGSAPQSRQRVAEGHTHTQPFLEEAKTDSVGLLTGLKEASGGLMEQSRDQLAPSGGSRKGRKRKQTLQNVLEDFRDMDTTTLEDPKPTAVLLKPERSVRGRRRRGTRSQRQ